MVEVKCVTHASRGAILLQLLALRVANANSRVDLRYLGLRTVRIRRSLQDCCCWNCTCSFRQSHFGSPPTHRIRQTLALGRANSICFCRARLAILRETFASHVCSLTNTARTHTHTTLHASVCSRHRASMLLPRPK